MSLKPEALRELPPPELIQMLAEARKELYDYRVDKTLGRAEQPHLLREKRRDVARILTVLNQKKQHEARAGEGGSE